MTHYSFFYNDSVCVVKAYVVKYLWTDYKNGVNFGVAFAIIFTNEIAMSIMVSDRTGGSLQC